jgi:hypothetical protein
MRRAPKIRYLRFYFYHWVDTSADGLLVPEGIICPVVSASELTSIYFLNLQFLNNIRIRKKNRVLLPHEYVTLADFGYSV